MYKAPGNQGSKVLRPIDLRAGYRFEHQVPLERSQFRELIVTNPNYFGTIPGSSLKAEKLMASNTTYEEISCIGFNPDTDELSAVVNLKQPGGYLTALCGAGSPEYVRFYLQDEATSAWIDQGVTSFTAHDMAHTDPLSYSVTLKISPRRDICSHPNLMRVRAILSWNDMPDANTPAFTPVWGQVKEVTIQVKPRTFVHVGLLDGLQGLSTVDASLIAGEIDAEATKAIAGKTPTALLVDRWQEMLQQKESIALRAATSIKAYMLANPKTSKTLMSQLNSVAPNYQVLLPGLLQTKANDQYEELTCVGYNQNVSQLAATLVVKQSSGYLQGLCYAGSREHVAFWVDWGDGDGWTYAGTNSVRVHDVPGAVESNGIHYAVTLPLSAANTHTAPCTLGPRIYRVRAILSWETLPSQTDPNWVPHWGSIAEADFQVKPGPVITEGAHVPLMDTVGSIPHESINAAGLANGTSVNGFDVSDSPFGGLVTITGFIANPPALSEPPLKYRIMVSDDLGASWQPVTNKFPIWVNTFTGTDWVSSKETQAPDGEWYTYRACPPNQFVSYNDLAWWYTSPHEGKWQIRMDVMEPDGTVITGSQVVNVLLDQTPPQVSLNLNTTGGPCGTFEPNTAISGSYVVSDAHLRTFSLHVDPHALTTTESHTFSTATVYPLIGHHADGTVTVNGLAEPCGYVLTLEAWDRTIVNSRQYGWYSHSSVGFCVRKATS